MTGPLKLYWIKERWIGPSYWVVLCQDMFIFRSQLLDVLFISYENSHVTSLSDGLTLKLGTCMQHLRSSRHLHDGASRMNEPATQTSLPHEGTRRMKEPATRSSLRNEGGTHEGACCTNEPAARGSLPHEGARRTREPAERRSLPNEGGTHEGGLGITCLSRCALARLAPSVHTPIHG